MKALISATHKHKTWWSESSIQDELIEFGSKQELKQKVEQLIKDKDCAINKRIYLEPAYKDSDNKQIGYYCTATIECLDNNSKWKKIPFQIWIDVTILSELTISDI